AGRLVPVFLGQLDAGDIADVVLGDGALGVVVAGGDEAGDHLVVRDLQALQLARRAGRDLVDLDQRPGLQPVHVAAVHGELQARRSRSGDAGGDGRVRRPDHAIETVGIAVAGVLEA